MSRRLWLPPDLERRLQRIERELRRIADSQELLAEVLDVDLERAEVARSPGVVHGMPSTWHEYEEHVRRLAEAVP